MNAAFPFLPLLRTAFTQLAPLPSSSSFLRSVACVHGIQSRRLLLLFFSTSQKTAPGHSLPSLSTTSTAGCWLYKAPFPPSRLCPDPPTRRRWWRRRRRRRSETVYPATHRTIHRRSLLLSLAPMSPLRLRKRSRDTPPPRKEGEEEWPRAHLLFSLSRPPFFVA